MPKTLVENRWSHIAVVLDPASRTLTSYVDGARVGQATNVNATLAQLVPSATTKSVTTSTSTSTTYTTPVPRPLPG